MSETCHSLRHSGKAGISFGGVVSFVFADLITLPLLLIYRKYFGLAITLRILATFWATMALAGLGVAYLFKAIQILIQRDQR